MTKKYSSILDQFLDEIAPNFNELGLKGPKKIGDEFKEMSAAEADMDFLDTVAGKSKHTTTRGGSSVTAATNPPSSSRGAWGAKAVKEMTNDSVLSEAFTTLGRAEKTDENTSAIDEEAVKNKIKTLLNMGVPPSKIASQLKNASEVLPGYSSSMGAEFLKSQAGQLGIAYMEPNFYMKSCTASYDKVKKEGTLRALSVKKIAACDGCANNCSGSCNLYRKPIVASASELKRVIDEAIKSKAITASSVKESLIQLHEGSGEKEISRSAATRVLTPHVVRTAGDKPATAKKIASIKEIHVALTSGVPLSSVYKQASATYGTSEANAIVKKYIASLKDTNAKVVLAALDCSFLKNKLSSSNTIVGESKCAGCSYRSGMHCGMTGGTLLSFPGMNRVASNVIHHDGVKDGKQILAEWELDGKEDRPLEIREEAPETQDVDLTSTSRIDVV